MILKKMSLYICKKKYLQEISAGIFIEILQTYVYEICTKFSPTEKFCRDSRRKYVMCVQQKLITFY